MMGLHTLFMVAGLLGAIGALFAAPILWLGRRRIEWEAWMLLTPLVPFGVWFPLMTLTPLARGKSMANLIEIVYIIPSIPLAALALVLIGKRLPGRLSAALCTLGLALAGAAVCVLTPPLPE
ncbi:MAG: hypothetical protein FJX72_06920 [Armatimonadetes bacterium]|nr:hypothetical protein [Armatimonadota bacterium]